MGCQPLCFDVDPKGLYQIRVEIRAADLMQDGQGFDPVFTLLIGAVGCDGTLCLMNLFKISFQALSLQRSDILKSKRGV